LAARRACGTPSCAVTGKSSQFGQSRQDGTAPDTAFNRNSGIPQQGSSRSRSPYGTPQLSVRHVTHCDMARMIVVSRSRRPQPKRKAPNVRGPNGEPQQHRQLWQTADDLYAHGELVTQWLEGRDHLSTRLRRPSPGRGDRRPCHRRATQRGHQLLDAARCAQTYGDSSTRTLTSSSQRTDTTSDHKQQPTPEITSND
jgi:hypothetical protein